MHPSPTALNSSAPPLPRQALDSVNAANPTVARRRHAPPSSSSTKIATARASAVTASRTAAPPVVELTVETMSTTTTHVFLYSWYAVLLLSLAAQCVSLGLQWQSREFCGAHSEPLNALTLWNSTECAERQSYFVPDAWEQWPLHKIKTVTLPTTAPLRHSWLSDADVLRNVYRVSGDSHQWGAGDRVTANRAGDFTISPGTAESSAMTPTSTSTTTVSPRPTMRPYKRVYRLRWDGSKNFGDTLNSKLNRFTRIALSLASPMHNITPARSPGRTYAFLVALDAEAVDPAEDSRSSSSEWGESGSGDGTASEHSSSSSGNSSRTAIGLMTATTVPGGSNSSSDALHYVFNTTVRCYRDSPRCVTVVLPPSVAVATSTSRLTVTLLGVDTELATAETVPTAVGVVYQRASYTVAIIVWRYAALLYSAGAVVLFIYRAKLSQMIYEQYWVLALQFALLCYLNPLFIAGIVSQRGSSVLLFFEFHVPYYFIAVVVCFTFAVIAASFPWAEAGDNRLKPTTSATLDPAAETVAPAEVAGSTATSTRDNVPRRRRRFPPAWIHVILALYLVTVACLDIARAFFERWQWGTEALCVSYACVALDKALVGVLVGGFVVNAVALAWLQRNLSQWPYIETRPQQLASRIFIFIFYTSCVYFPLAQLVLSAVIHADELQVVYYRPLLQLPTLVIATVFVNHMTYVYMAVQPSDRVPVRPGDPQWRVLHWPAEWFRWLREHGGSQYIFRSEREELHFWDVQEGRAMPGWTSRPSLWRRSAGLPVPTPEPEGCEGMTLLLGTAPECPYAVANLREGVQPPAQAAPPRQRAHASDHLGTSRSRTAARSCPPASRERYPKAPGVIRWVTGASPSVPVSGLPSCNSISDSEPHHSLLADTSPYPPTAVFLSGDGSIVPIDDTDTDNARRRRHDSGAAQQTHIDVLRSRATTLIEAADQTLGGQRLRALVMRSSRWQRRKRSADASELCGQPPHQRHYPFFNLETAIDCFNMAWEAYGVTESLGDRLIQTSVLVDAWALPRAALQSARDWICCCRGCGSASGGRAPVSPNHQVEPPLDAVRVVVAAETTAPLLDRGASPLPPPLLSPISDAGDAASMCTERYGYRRLAVVHCCDVQVVVTSRCGSLGVDGPAATAQPSRPPCIIVAFRGTDNVSNALQDIRFRQRVWREMEAGPLTRRATVHSGFLEVWTTMKARVLAAVFTELRSLYQLPSTKTGGDGAGTESRDSWSLRSGAVHHDEFVSVHVTGHSLGGALAVLCSFSLRRALLMLKYPNPDVTVYTFGQPAIGNTTFKRLYNRAIPRTFRIVNESDAVAGFQIMGGHHVGVEVNIERNGNLVCEPMYIEKMFRPTQGKGFAVTNHSMLAYAHSLNAIAEQHAGGACPVRCLRVIGTDSTDDWVE